LRVDEQRRFWIEQPSEAIMNISHTRDDLGQNGMEIKTSSDLSHNTLTSAEEYIQS